MQNAQNITPAGWVTVTIPVENARRAAERLARSAGTNRQAAQLWREKPLMGGPDPDTLEQEAFILDSVALQLRTAIRNAEHHVPAPYCVMHRSPVPATHTSDLGNPLCGQCAAEQQAAGRIVTVGASA